MAVSATDSTAGRGWAGRGGAPVGPDLAGLWGHPSFLGGVTND